MYRLFTAILVALLGYCISAGAEAPSVYAENGVAINGYDPVAYVELTVAHAGSEEFSAKWMGVTWRFLSQEHLDKFMTSPETYTPQYGGYCAYAVSQNGLAKTDPQAFTVHEGKLYLNYTPMVSRLWRQGMHRFIEQANQNWPEVLSTSAVSD